MKIQLLRPWNRLPIGEIVEVRAGIGDAMIRAKRAIAAPESVLIESPKAKEPKILKRDKQK